MFSDALLSGERILSEGDEIKKTPSTNCLSVGKRTLNISEEEFTRNIKSGGGYYIIKLTVKQTSGFIHMVTDFKTKFPCSNILLNLRDYTSI